MNNFKNIGFGLLVLMGVSFSSCSEDFLDEDLTSQYATNYFDTPEGLVDLSQSLYGNIRWHFGFGWAHAITSLGCDEFTTGNDLTNEMWNTYDNRLGPVGATVATGAANNNATSPAALWDEMYFGIASANTIIEKADKVITDEAVRNRCLAHAYFLRGYNFYRLTAQYGGIVLQTKPITTVVRNFDRSTEEESWAQAISDLRNAYKYFAGEDFVYGKGITWTKATAAHFLAKALLFRSSERCAEWNSEYKDADLKEAIEATTYAINARGGKLTANYSDLYANWTGVDCPNEQLDEILMAAGFNSDAATAGRFGNQTGPSFTPQFSNFAGGWVIRGVWIGSMDFQACRPTEYTYSVFDHVNDARMWKTFKTVFGTNVVKDNTVGVKLGDPGIVMILNSKNDHTYDSYKFGCAATQNPNWKDDNGRLAEWTVGNRQTATAGNLTATKGQFVPSSLVLYQNGEYVAPTFGNTARCNFFAGINKTDDGSRNGERSNANRDVIMARLAETFLMRAECNVRLGRYSQAMADINVVRARAQWKNGENRSFYSDGSLAFKTNPLNTGAAAANYVNSNLEMNTYYLSNPQLAVTTAASDLTLKTFPANLPVEDEAILSKIGASSDYQRAMHFLLNERTRESLGEWDRWETLSRTGTLITRAKAFNPDATLITANKHEYRPIPQSFIDGLLNDDGTNLTADQKAAWQNSGY
ncbi:RagB/SusD family nutrient uptake outer membrane protein [Flavobacterium adhaerens]|uniref:RagB/SusD family nutrient uptake outer membrane protein n=1 Tax=Flavobacterium adhaerens TaxID=3149043 RepID=UPI0032B36098